MDKCLKITVIKNPFEVSKGRIVEDVPFNGQDLADIIADYAADQEYIIVSVNQIQLPAAEKDKYRVELRSGDEIVIIPAVRDVVGAIVSVTTWLTSSATAASIFSALWSAGVAIGISVGAAYLIRAIGGSPDDAKIDTSPSYNWSPVTMQRQGIAIPRAYGMNKEYGNVIAGWRTPDGSDETLNLLIAFNDGPDGGMVDDTLYINGQPADNYDNITTYERDGTMNQTAIFNALKCEYQPEIEVIHTDDGGGPVTWTTPDADYDSLEIAVKYSGHYVHKDGGTEIQYVGVKIEISEHDAETWYTLVDELLACNSTSTLQKNYLSTGSYTGGSPVSITKGTRCDIKVTKTNAGRLFRSNRQSRYLWFSTVREVINTAFTYPGLSLIGVSALATEDISGALQISCIRKGRIVNVYNGSSWELLWSNNPVWIIWDIMTRPVISGDGGGTAYAIERYDGIDPARLTPYLSEWYEAAQYFDELVLDGEGGTQASITFNGVFDAGMTVWEAVNKVCAMARCEVIQIGRNYTILVDKPYDGNPVQLFSAGNIKPGTYRKNYIDLEDRAGELEIDYQDQDLDYQMTPMLHVDTGIDSGAPKVIEGFGITRATQAWRLLYYELAKNRLLKYTVTFECDVDALACRKGDIVLVVEPWRLGGRIVSSPASNKVVLEAAPKTSAADTIAVRVNHPDTGAETVETHTVASVDGAEVTISDTWSINPKKDDLYAFGPTATIIKKFRVVGITQRTD
jgi:predicted phage tail protein